VSIINGAYIKEYFTQA